MDSFYKCKSCGFRTAEKSVCRSINCPTYVVREFGEILDFGTGVLKFSPKIGSSLQPVVFYEKTYDEVVAFLQPILSPMLKRKN